MTESADQSNQHQSGPRKQKNSIKDIIHNFFKPGIETQLILKNMVLNDIPTQTTPVFINIRQGRERIDTQAVKIVDNTANWQDEVIIDCRVPSIDSSQQPPQRQQNNTNTNSTNPTSSQQQPQRQHSLSNLHDYDNYDNYDNYEYEQPDENESTSPGSTKEPQTNPDSNSNISTKNQDKSEKGEKSERTERRREKKERRELERREKKEKKEKEKREKKENKEKEKKEKKERKESSNSSYFCLEFTFRLEDVSGRSSTIYGKTVLDLTQITAANDWEYRAILHECNYESVFSCLISINTKKRKSSAMVESLPPLPSSNSNSNQTVSLMPPAKMPSSLNSRIDQNIIYRNIERDRSYTERPPKKIPIHESASFDGINSIASNKIRSTNPILVENTDSELNDAIYNDDNNNSESISYTSSRRSRLSSSLKSSNNDTNSSKKSSNTSKSHGHQRTSHGHRKNDIVLKSAASTIIIPLDQNGNDEFEEKLPFKVQKDRLERLSDQVDDIINNAFYSFSEENY